MSGYSEVVETPLAGAFVLRPVRFEDHRGSFSETWSRRAFSEATGADVAFAQDNQSGSRRGVLRGLHYQLPQAQGKLVRVVAGEAFDVCVDMRRSSGSFGAWFGIELSASNGKQLWVPEGFAHGFVALSEWAEVAYKATHPYVPEAEHVVRWDDPQLGIDWPVDVPELSPRDAAGSAFVDSPSFP